MIPQAISRGRRNVSGKSQPRAQGGDNSVDVCAEHSSPAATHRMTAVSRVVSTALSRRHEAADLHKCGLSPVSTGATKTSESIFLSYLLTTLWGRPTVGENA